MSEQERRTRHARQVGRLALAALLGWAVMGLSGPGPARTLTRAVCTGNVITNVRLSQGRADVGEDPHLLGNPSNAGRICWSTASPGGAILEGQLYYDDLFNPGCAHITVAFETGPASAGGRVVSTYSNTICGTGGLRQKSVFSQVSGSIRQITIRLFTSERANGTGPRTQVGSKVFSL